MLLRSDKNVIKTASYEKWAKCLTATLFAWAACLCDHYGTIIAIWRDSYGEAQTLYISLLSPRQAFPFSHFFRSPDLFLFSLLLGVSPQKSILKSGIIKKLSPTTIHKKIRLIKFHSNWKLPEPYQCTTSDKSGPENFVAALVLLIVILFHFIIQINCKFWYVL